LFRIDSSATVREKFDTLNHSDKTSVTNTQTDGQTGAIATWYTNNRIMYNFTSEHAIKTRSLHQKFTANWRR